MEKFNLNSEAMTHADVAELLGCLIDTVEDWLDSKGVTPDDVPNPERTGEDDEAIIYGSDYDFLADCFAATLGISRDAI